MRMLGGKSLRLTGRWLRSRGTERALILGYHRVADEASDPLSLCVSRDHFAQQLEAICRHGRPVGLGELVRTVSNGDPLRRAVAITFDDGYADLLTCAKPILERYGVPATAFLIADFLGQELWWDALSRILRTPSKLPDRLRLTTNGNVFEWASGVTDRARGSRNELLSALYRRLLPLPEEQRRRALAGLSAWAGVSQEERTSCRALEPDEVVRLARGGLIEVGAHTSTHPILPALPGDRQRLEIERSKAELEELVRRPVVNFSFPHGRTSAETVALVRESGFESACTSRNDVVRRGSDRFDLPRFWVQDWGGAKFSRWLTKWLGPPHSGGS